MFEWTYGKQVDAGFLGCREEGFESEDTGSIEDTLLSFQQSPIGVERYTIIAKSFDLLEHVQPETGYWQSERVEFTAVEQNSFAMDEERTVVPGLKSSQASTYVIGVGQTYDNVLKKLSFVWLDHLIGSSPKGQRIC